MNQDTIYQKGQPEISTATGQPRFVEVFGFRVPTDTYYVHRGHAWTKVEENGRVRVGLDDFSQKVLGPVEDIEFPEIGNVYYQNHVFMPLVRQGQKAKILAPVDGLIEEINPKVRQEPRLIHDDPYADGWLFLVKPINLKYNLNNLHYGETAAAWID